MRFFMRLRMAEVIPAKTKISKIDYIGGLYG